MHMVASDVAAVSMAGDFLLGQDATLGWIWTHFAKSTQDAIINSLA